MDVAEVPLEGAGRVDDAAAARVVHEVDRMRRADRRVRRRQAEPRPLPQVDRALSARALPRLADGVEYEGAGGADDRLGPGDLGLHDRPLGEGPTAPGRRLRR